MKPSRTASLPLLLIAVLLTSASPAVDNFSARAVTIGLDSDAFAYVVDELGRELDPMASLKELSAQISMADFDAVLALASSIDAQIDTLSYFVLGDRMRAGGKNQYFIVDLGTGTTEMVDIEEGIVVVFTEEDRERMRSMRAGAGQPPGGVQDMIARARGLDTSKEPTLGERGDTIIDGKRAKWFEYDAGTRYADILAVDDYDYLVNLFGRVKEMMAGMGEDEEDDVTDLVVAESGMFPWYSQEVWTSGFSPVPRFKATLFLTVEEGGATHADVERPEYLEEMTFEQVMQRGPGRPRD